MINVSGREGWEGETRERPEGAQALAGALHGNSVLHTLSLVDNALGPKSAAGLSTALADGSGLKSLNLTGESFDEDSQLSPLCNKQYPSCTININIAIGLMGTMPVIDWG